MLLQHASIEPDASDMVFVQTKHEASETKRMNRAMSKLRHDEKDLLQMVSVFQSMLDDPDVPFPDVVSFNIVIDTLGKHGHLPFMIEYFCIMIEYGIRPSVITFTSMLDACTKQNDVHQACILLQIMQAMGIESNEITRTVLSRLR